MSYLWSHHKGHSLKQETNKQKGTNALCACALYDSARLHSQEAEESPCIHGTGSVSGAAPHRGTEGHDPPPNDGLVVAAAREPGPDGLVSPLGRVVEGR